MVAMSYLLEQFRGSDHRGLDGNRPAGSDRRRTPWGRSFSGGWRGPAFLLRAAKPNLFGGGKKLDSAVAAQAIEAKPAVGQIAPKRGRLVPARTASLGDYVANSGRHRQEMEQDRGRNGYCRVQIGWQLGSAPCRRATTPPASESRPAVIGHAGQALDEPAARLRASSTIRPSDDLNAADAFEDDDRRPC
jgi:hypothetical protein